MIEATNDPSGEWWVLVENLLRKQPLPKFVSSHASARDARVLARERNRMEESRAKSRSPYKQPGSHQPRYRHFTIQKAEAVAKYPHLAALAGQQDGQQAGQAQGT